MPPSPLEPALTDSATLMSSADDPAPWWELCLRVASTHIEDAAALLVDGGAMGAETFSATEFAARAWQQHRSAGPRAPIPTAVDEPDGKLSYTIASFTLQWSEADIEALVQHALREALGTDVVQVGLRRCHDVSWAHAWREHYKPMKVGRRLWVVPSWEHKFCPPAGSLVVSIDPGMAFGTGQHATTALCLKAIERRALALGPAWGQARVLDVGAGTGILGLAALQLGAHSAVLCDIDPLAVQACQTNVARSPFGARVRVSDAMPPAEGAFLLVVANILAPTLIKMAPTLLAQLHAKGTLVLSGILAEQSAEVLAAFERAARELSRAPLPAGTLRHEPWVALAIGAPLDAASAARIAF